jgi:acyl-coenzyme A thioesterase PaaI-like protein
LSLEPATIKASILKIGRNIVSVEGKIYKEKNKLVASCLHTGFLFDTHGMKK